jgi:hypothetical protein
VDEAPTPGLRPSADPQYTVERPVRIIGDGEPAVSSLGVAEGFKFGCGFMMAAGIALLVGFVALSAGFLLASLLGIPLPIGGAG